MNAHPLQGLMDQLATLPGVGYKSAQRLAFHFLSLPPEKVKQFAQVVTDTRNRIRYCHTCYNVSFHDQCFICADPKRHTQQLCVVAEPKDVFAIERTEDYHGFYHVLGGLISPIDRVYPETLRIQELLQRIHVSTFTEIILAINPTIEGEATMLYLTKQLQEINVSVSTLAYGLPVGSDMDYADQLTLQKAFSGRRVVEV